MSRTYYLTTPLYYVNDIPHVGHAYTTIIADSIARYRRLCGMDVCFLTGTDEHGLKIERAAREQRITAQQLTDSNAQAFESSWKRMGITFDEFIRTTDSRHYAAVQDIFRRIKSKGFIYEAVYSGEYCVRCESYVQGKEKSCPDCGAPTEFIKEDSYFFKLSAFQEKLLAFYEDNPDFVIPETRMNEVVSFVRGGLRDISISRSSFSWGIPVPEKGRHIFYVWFDALHGYLSGIGYGSSPDQFQKVWPAEVQLMGKDILRFHAVYWPAFLMAAGLEPPRHLLVHGWWTINGEKMSKSLGNFITVEALLRALPLDYIKYFLLREIAIGADGDFSYEALVSRVNSDLANDLGNLSNRILKMVENYFDGLVPAAEELDSGDTELMSFCRETVKLYQENFNELKINRALDNIWELISVANKYIVAHEPWNLAKTPSKRGRLGTVLYCSAETLRILSVLLGPVIPQGTAAILGQLGIKKPLDEFRLGDLNWGQLAPGTRIGEVQAVYPRLDRNEFLSSVEQRPDAPAHSEQPAADAGRKITIEDFAKIEMRVGRIVEAEGVPGSEKLLRLIVDIGDENRQVIAGIGKAYDPGDLRGRLVVIVTNLAPAKLMGHESNGMIVAASDDGKPVLATFTESVRVGSRLR